MTDQLLLVVGVTTLCMLSPGPDMVLVMRNTLTRGRRFGGLTALGTLTGNLVHISYCALGLGWLLSRSVLAFNVLKFGSAIYLMYLGIQGLRSRGAEAVESASETGGGQRGAYMQGLINNLLNPKGSLFYLGVFSQVITKETSVGQTLVLIAVMLSVSTVFWVLFVQTLHLPAIRARMTKSRVFVDRAFGLVLLVLGAKVALLK